MLIWLVILAIFGVLGITSYYKGAIRSLVSLVGLIVALFATMPLAPHLAPLIPKLGLVHPLWSVFLPPVIVFLLIALLFGAAGFFVHHKLSLHFKYGTDDYNRIRWERLNQRLGLGVGFVAASIYCVLVCLIIYIFGYPLVQVTGDESPTLQRLIAQARQDLHSSGFDRTLSSLDPMNDNYYLTSDIIGLLYRNGVVLQDRLYNYPPFLGLSERQEFKDIATDTDLQQLLQTSGPAVDILRNAKILAVVNNQEITDQLKQVDLKDLYSYLRTGRSEKYADEKILGRWKLDASATLVMARRKNPDMPVAEMARIKRMITVFMPKVTFMATPDNHAAVHMELTDEAKRLIEGAKAAAQAAVDAAQGGQTPAMPPGYAQRYFPTGRGRQGPGVMQQPPAAAAAPSAQARPTPGIPELNLSSSGTWARDGIKYKLKLKDEKNNEQSGEASIVDPERMLLTMSGQTMVFVR